MNKEYINFNYLFTFLLNLIIPISWLENGVINYHFHKATVRISFMTTILKGLILQDGWIANA